MNSRVQARSATFAFVVLLTLLAFATVAQASGAAHFSNGSAATTAAAGTQGRGGIDASATMTVASTSFQAGTEGRGGASLTVVAGTPQAGTQGRGGIASVEATASSGAGTASGSESASRARGGFPAGSPGFDRTLAASSATSTSSWWIATGITLAVVALIAGLFVWAANRRRPSESQSSLASFCAQNPADSLCGAG